MIIKIIQLCINSAELQHIYEVRPHISPLVELMLIQSRNPFIAPSTPSLTVLLSQQEILHDGPQEQEKHEIGKDNTVAGVVMRCIITAVDIGRDDSIKVTPADHQAHSHTTFIHTCSLARKPNNWR